MAKVGEGDPRWIVANRADGQNVNDWHWVERNALPTAEKIFATAFTKVALPADDVTITATKAEVSGEAAANNRKGKTIFLYELEVTVSFEAERHGSSCSGTYKLPYVADENEDERYDIRITTSGDKDVGAAAENALRGPLRNVIQDMVHSCLEEMKDRFRKPKAQLEQVMPSPGVKIDEIDSPAPAAAASHSVPPAAAEPFKGRAPSTGSFVLKDTFATSPKELYTLFLDAQRLSMLTCSKVAIAPKLGEFTMFSGAVSGEVTELVENSKIVQKWRFNSWEPNRYSVVTLTFNEKEKHRTELVLEQNNIPASDVERTKMGWKENFLSRIPVIFGFVRAPGSI